MSKYNKVNKDSYTQRGRLTPDEIAHERMQHGATKARASSNERGTRANPRQRRGRREGNSSHGGTE